MDRSVEIEAVFRRLMAALRAQDAAAVKNLISTDADVRMILTGEDECGSAQAPPRAGAR